VVWQVVVLTIRSTRTVNKAGGFAYSRPCCLPVNSNVRSRTIAKTFHVALGLFVFRSSKACSFGFRYTVQLVFPGCATPLLLFFQRVVIMRFCFITFAMRKVYFTAVLAVPAFRSIIGKPFLTRCCSGLTHIAASTAELIR
jgi:hypothetical protein